MNRQVIAMRGASNRWHIGRMERSCRSASNYDTVEIKS